MTNQSRPEIPAIPVRQWLNAWENIEFNPKYHRRKPSNTFYIFTMAANQLRALCDIQRRRDNPDTPPRNDLGIQRGHSEDRSDEIAEFVKNGFPWSSIPKSKRESEEFKVLKKPGWLPTAIVLNIVGPAGNSDGKGDGKTVAPDDLFEIVNDDKVAAIRLPVGFDDPQWKATGRAPLEVIDGQHRLWSFDKNVELDGHFDLPVVAFYDLDISWQAYLFYVINIKPTKINTSLAFDLYPLLRTEDWLDKYGGLTIYRESRAQELTEAMSSHSKSPFHSRIDMLGNRGRKFVTQTSWIRSLLATFVKKWDRGQSSIGGLFGAPITGEKVVLSWNRSQQAAFLIYLWIEFRDAVKKSDEDWTRALREDESATQIAGDAAFEGSKTLSNTDQGVRALLAVANDLCYVNADALALRDWVVNNSADGTSEDAVSDSLSSLRGTKVADFITNIMNELSDYDWRTSSAPKLSTEQQQKKMRFKGSSGYRELKIDLLMHLKNKAGAPPEVATLVLKNLDRF